MTDVERGSGSLLVNPELVWLHLRRPTALGSKRVFTPGRRFSFALSRRSLAAELEARVAQASRGAASR